MVYDTQMVWQGLIVYDTQMVWQGLMVYDTQMVWQGLMVYDTQMVWQGLIVYDTDGSITQEQPDSEWERGLIQDDNATWRLSFKVYTS